MKAINRAVLFILAAVFCAAPSGAWAWNAAGHRLVAAIAWNEMKPKAREEAARLLRLHPDYSRWLARAGAEDADRRVFIEASTWPDEIRKDARFYSAGKGEPTPALPGFPDMERRSDWHYVSIPLDAGFDGKPLSGQLDRRLPELVRTLDEAGPQTDAARVYALPWMIHLAGDSHQPLHASAQSGGAGRWDKLGNGLQVRNPFNPRKPVSTLHAFWDDLPGPPWLRGDRLDAAALALAAAHARVNRSVDTERWIEESWRLARDKAYPAVQPGSDDVPEITETFYAASREIADRRVAQAGFRLAAVLNRAFAARQPADRPDQR